MSQALDEPQKLSLAREKSQVSWVIKRIMCVPCLIPESAQAAEEETGGGRRAQKYKSSQQVRQAVLGVWLRGSAGPNRQQHQEQVPGTEGHLPASFLSTTVGVFPQAAGCPLKWHGPLSFIRLLGLSPQHPTPSFWKERILQLPLFPPVLNSLVQIKTSELV